MEKTNHLKCVCFNIHNIKPGIALCVRRILVCLNCFKFKCTMCALCDERANYNSCQVHPCFSFSGNRLNVTFKTSNYKQMNSNVSAGTGGILSSLHSHTYTRNQELTTLIEHLSKRLHYSTWILNVVRSVRMADSQYKTTELDFSDCHKWFLEPCRLNVSISFLYSDMNGANGLNWKW